MAKYSKKAGEKVEKAMHEKKQGKLKSGSGETVRSRKQAIAIGLSEARKEGAKVPAKSSKKVTKKSTSSSGSKASVRSKKPGPKKVQKKPAEL